MSFFTNNRNERCPGTINGNPLNGLCEKVCIQTTKVFDSCMKQISETQNITLTTFNPATYTEPLTFVSGQTTGTAAISNVSVERFDERPNFARVQATISIPVSINYTDANGVSGVGTGFISIDEDVVMFVPQPSIVPFTITGFANAVITNATYLGNGVFASDVCITAILKVVVEAQILIPAYGYCPIPPCQDYTQEVCSGFFDLPLYPR
ncbi:MAG: hypothetical protein IJW82_04900 [Clostridia bacterium]|nr:hypothetical protein [Clostridia bacterium]